MGKCSCRQRGGVVDVRHDVARRGAVDVRADHRVVDLCRPPLVTTDDRTAGSAALASARDLEVDRPHRGDEPAQVRAVPAVNPLRLPLPLPGADHLSDLVLPPPPVRRGSRPGRGCAGQFGSSLAWAAQARQPRSRDGSSTSLGGEACWDWTSRSFPSLFTLRDFPIHTILGTRTRRSSPRRWSSTRVCGRRGCSR